ncbi:MAG: DUF3568 family protein [Phycisphaera sp.]|nr:MAG: DUF3568 family protein [Phycisphaera sp.]
MARRLTIPLIVIALTVTGCVRTTATQGYHDIRANWSFGTLEAKLPEGYRAGDVAAAAESALTRMGYTVTDRAESEQRATLEARQSGSAVFEKVVVRATPDGRRVRLKISVRPMGDEDSARILLDEMLVLLGL